MKTLTTSILSMAMLLAMPVIVSAQVYNGNLTLSTQAEVDAFNYKEVTGSLTIGNLQEGAPSTDITSLQPLSSLTKVGDLIISNNDSLQNLLGLENISSVGYLSIDHNDQLQDLQGLEGLSSASFLKIISNGQLQHLQGLENLTSIDLGLAITHNNQLQDLEGLANLSGISFEVNSSNAPGQDSQHLANPSTMGDGNMNENNQFQQAGISEDDLVYGLRISDNDQLKNLKGLRRLTVIDVYDGRIIISSNASLTSLQGLENLTSTSVGNELVMITSNPSLTSLQGLNNFTSIVGDLLIGGNSALVSLEGLDNLNVVVGYFHIENNAQLQNLKGLESFTSAEGIVIADNAQLEDLEGLDNLSNISDVDIIDNPKLTSLNNLGSVTQLGSLRIWNNNQLQNLLGLENLSSIGLLSIVNNDLLKNLQGLENLTSVGIRLVIDDNDQLEDLQGLENLTAINSYLQITNNSALVSLQALENLQSVHSLGIQRNPNLNDCCAIAVVVARARGTKDINNNGSNCNSVETIQENCPPVITRFTLIDAVTDQDIFNINEATVPDPEVIKTYETGIHLNIRANAAGQVGSVVFELDGVIVRKENVAPYALFGDEPTGDYHSGMLALGRHTLTATPYEGKNGKGQAGESLTLEFVVIDQPLAVTSFFLVTTDNDQTQYELKDGSTISLQQFDNTKLNILANTFPSFVGSVVFSLNKVKKFRTENVYPYLLAGDNPPGNYNDYTFTPGTYHLTATPYSMPKGQGEAGNPLSITFEVVENEGDQMAVARTIPATSFKTKVVDAAEDLSVAQHATQVWVYPNPSDEVLQVQVAGQQDSQSPVNLILYNPLGQKVWEGKAAVNQTTNIEISHLPGGTYFLKTVGSRYSHIQRVLVK